MYRSKMSIVHDGQNNIQEKHKFIVKFVIVWICFSLKKMNNSSINYYFLSLNNESSEQSLN